MIIIATTTITIILPRLELVIRSYHYSSFIGLITFMVDYCEGHFRLMKNKCLWEFEKLEHWKCGRSIEKFFALGLNYSTSAKCINVIIVLLNAGEAWNYLFTFSSRTTWCGIGIFTFNTLKAGLIIIIVCYSMVY